MTALSYLGVTGLSFTFAHETAIPRVPSQLKSSDKTQHRYSTGICTSYDMKGDYDAIVKNISQIVNGKSVIVKKPELLAPAGNLEKLKIAVQYGADAVFIGGQEYGLRSNADNFTFEEMKEGVEFAKKYGAKIYVTTNIFAHNENIDGLEEYINRLKRILGYMELSLQIH